MSDHLVKVAREQLAASMQDMKGFTNKLLIMIVSLFLIARISYVNNRFIHAESRELTPINFLDVPIYPEYISFIYGLLYLAYIGGIFIKIRQFGQGVDMVQEKGLADQVFDSVTLYHWSLSPFHKTKSSYSTFVAILCLMCIHLAALSIGHILGVEQVPITASFPKPLFVGIGVFDAAVLCIFVIVVYHLIGEIAELRRKLGS